jgi:GNAT superfamily N-acetyltransferase
MTGLRALYDACFPGDGVFADYFFAELYASERTLTVTEDGVPVAMLCRFPRSLEVNGAEYPVHYLYAIATMPAQRGKGHASRLIRESAKIARDEGAAALAVILQSKNLLPFYERLGFAPVSLWDETAPVTCAGGMRLAAAEDIPLLDALYNERSDGKILRSRDDWTGILQTYGVRVGDGFYLASSDGVTKETSDGHPARARSAAEATVVGCLLDLTEDQSLSGLTNIYMNLMFN